MAVSVFPMESPVFRGLKADDKKPQWAKILATLVSVWEKAIEF